ncbi:MAG TPA: aldo/keto reductase [Streptosporangiaceae bacterium]|nr:aldo/keto reductase [Streptosporangiaceae bacterium]
MSASSVTADGRSRVLADGLQMPMLGLGVWQVPDGPACVNAVRCALDLGYRHIDTAQAYGNEESVGKALRDSGLARDEVFITTKFYPVNRDPVAALEQSRIRLGVDQVDLYLIHWPAGGPMWAWPGMERVRQMGAARAIGVSNFSVRELEQLIAEATQRPAVNQVDFSPVHYRRGLLDACSKQDVAVEAYSPLGTGRHLSNKTVRRVAERAGRTPAQVLLRWCLQHGIPVIPKSTHRERIEENAQIFDFDLSDEQMTALDSLDRTGGTQRALERKWW